MVSAFAVFRPVSEGKEEAQLKGKGFKMLAARLLRVSIGGGSCLPSSDLSVRQPCTT